jgi:hypothetical protein
LEWVLNHTLDFSPWWHHGFAQMAVNVLGQRQKHGEKKAPIGD